MDTPLKLANRTENLLNLLYVALIDASVLSIVGVCYPYYAVAFQQTEVVGIFERERHHMRKSFSGVGKQMDGWWEDGDRCRQQSHFVTMYFNIFLSDGS